MNRFLKQFKLPLIGVILLIISIAWYFFFRTKIQVVVKNPDEAIQTREGGKYVIFPESFENIHIFETEIVGIKQINFDLKAPATVAVRFRRVGSNRNSTVPVFASPDLASVYSSYQQALSLLAIARVNYARSKDLFDHGATTGRDLNDAASEKFSQEALLGEAESKLLAEGLDPKNQIIPGMYGKLTVRLKDKGRLIPKKSIFIEDGKIYVFVKKGEREFEKREITLSTEASDFAEILSGVEDGESVVTENAYLLKGLSQRL